MQGSKRAVIGMVIFSVLSPLLIVLLTIKQFWLILPMPIVFFGIGAAYYYIIFYKNRDDKQGFRVLLAFISTVIQEILIIALFKLYFYFKPVSFENGHPNGPAILMLLIIMAEPVIINAVPIVIWIEKKLVLINKSFDENGSENELYKNKSER